MGGKSDRGIVTIEDLIEELVGDIFGEHDLPEEAVRVEPDGSALVPGWLPTRKVNRALNTTLPITRESTTVAGLCMALALAVPPIGSVFRATDGKVLEIVAASPVGYAQCVFDRRRPKARPERNPSNKRDRACVGPAMRSWPAARSCPSSANVIWSPIRRGALGLGKHCHL